jgi:ABC-type enterochelin transport system ATPase subunit
VVTSKVDLFNKVLPHFNKFSLKTSKQLNYLDFKKAVELLLIDNNANDNIIKEIIVLKSKMNKARTFEEKFNFCKNSNIVLEPN